MAKSITKPKNVIPTVVILDPAANRNVSRIQEDNSIKEKHEASIEIINGKEVPVATDEQIQDIIDGYRSSTFRTASDEDVQRIMSGSSNESSTSDSDEEFDESNMISATDEDIWDIINSYGK